MSYAINIREGDLGVRKGAKGEEKRARKPRQVAVSIGCRLGSVVLLRFEANEKIFKSRRCAVRLKLAFAIFFSPSEVTFSCSC
jgi:hypothetical protein